MEMEDWQEEWTMLETIMMSVSIFILLREMGGNCYRPLSVKGDDMVADPHSMRCLIYILKIV
jgi:hypothetical protein